MPDPLAAAAEALLKTWAPDEEVPLEQWFEEMEPHVTALRAALAAHRQRDERAEAAVALCEAQDACWEATEAWMADDAAAPAYNAAVAAHDAARRRWAEVEGRRA